MSEWVEWTLVALILSVFVAWLASGAANDTDRQWLPRIVFLGFMVKLVGTTMRYYMVADLYRGGDSFQYHLRGLGLSSIWRDLAVPALPTGGGEGTAFTEVVTGLVYAIYQPTMRTGFLMFAFIAFLGQFAFYIALRPWLRGKASKRYALAIFFFPSLVFWPASIGKDALMIFFLGIATWGISKLLMRFDLVGLTLAGSGLVLAAQIRPHIAAMLALAAVLAFLFMRRSEGPAKGARRFVPLVLALLGFVLAWSAFADQFAVSIAGVGDSRDPVAFLEQVENQTAQGGSEVDGGVVDSITDIPAATLKVLFRPLIFEGTSLTILLSAVEGTVFLLFVVWRLPTMVRNRSLVRRNPLLLLSFFYTGGFIIAFSAVLNLGIMARQRVQVLPFLLAFLVVMAWPREEAGEEPDRDVGRRQQALTSSRAS